MKGLTKNNTVHIKQEMPTSINNTP